MKSSRRGKSRCRAWLCLWLCAWSGGWTVASPAAANYSTRLWQMEDGLPHNIVQAITQTRDGYLWVGTREGLARFDGVRFQPVELSSESPHPSVRCLVEGADGSLWIGTEDAGLFRSQAGRISRLPAPDGARTYSVYALHRSGDALWIASSAGVLRWADDALQRQSDFRNLVESLCVDPAGGVWLAGDGLRRLDGAAEKYPVRAGALPRDVRVAYCNPGGTFWLAAESRGLTELCDGVAAYHHKAEGRAGFVSAILQDHSGVLWVGTYLGLSWFVDGVFVNETEPDDPTYHIFAIFEDREGGVWVGSEAGLTRYAPKAFKSYTRRDGLTLPSVVTVCASRDGSIWVGQHGGGLSHFVDGRFVPFGRAEGLSSEFVMALCEGRDGSLWVGTDYGNALNRIQDGQVTHYGPAQGFVTAVATALVEDGGGRLWIGTRDGLQCFEEGRFTNYLTGHGLSHNKINALCPGGAGGLWIGTSGGLSRWRDGVFTNLAATAPQLKTTILSLHEDGDGILWIGTLGDGLFRFHDGQTRVFSLHTGLFSDSIYAVLEDHRGNLWLNSSRGVFRVAKAGLDAVAAGRQPKVSSIAYGKADGVIGIGQYREVTQPAACKSRDGRLWFRTTQGVAVVDPARITPNETPPPVVIEEIIADRQPLAHSPPSAPDTPVIVPKGRGELEIRFTALSLRAPEKNSFRYQLEGVDPDWVEAGNRRSAYYNKVAPGDYRFRVAACNNDGVWNEAGATVRLHVEPHFWETPWFFATCTMLAIGGIVSAAAGVTRARMRRELQRLEQQHAIERERARIARDMHDELGAKLTRISFQGASARRGLENPAIAGPQIEKMAQTARELVASLDEIVWAVDPENDTLENLVRYICRHAGEFFENSPVACEFAIPTALPAHRLASDARHSLFLATKEALTNVLKHAQARRVRIQVTPRGGELEIEITDDGVGIPEAAAPAEAAASGRRAGHGLANMRERLAALGGRAEITRLETGTRVRFIVPLR